MKNFDQDIANLFPRTKFLEKNDIDQVQNKDNLFKRPSNKN